MGNFNTKHDVPKTQNQIHFSEQEEETIQARTEERSVSERGPRNCSQNDCKPHGLVLSIKEQKLLENADCVDIGLNSKPPEILIQSPPLLNNCYQRYSNYNSENTDNVNKIHTESSAAVNMTQIKPKLLEIKSELKYDNREPLLSTPMKIVSNPYAANKFDIENLRNVTQIKPKSLEIKKEFGDENDLQPDREKDNSLSTSIKTVPNPYDVAENNLNDQDLKNTFFKREVIQKNSVESANELVYRESCIRIRDYDWIPKAPSEFGVQNFAGKGNVIGQSAKENLLDKPVKQEMIKEIPNSEKLEKSSRWITNPFALLASLASLSKNYTYRESTQKIVEDTSNKKLATEENDVKNGNPNLIANSLGGNEQNKKFKGIKLELEPETDGLSEYHSLCNTSFDSLPQISNGEGSQSSKDDKPLNWMVKFPGYTNTSFQGLAGKNALIENRNGNSRSRNKAALSKSKQLNKEKQKVKSRRKKNTMVCRKYSQRTKTGNRNYIRKKRKVYRRSIVTDKTYCCPIAAYKINYSTDRKMRLRARKKDNFIKNKHILFLKPLLDEKPQTVSPPRPMQPKMTHSVKWEELEAAYEPIMLLDNVQYDSKGDLSDTVNISSVPSLHPLSHKAEGTISQLEKRVKMEIEYEEFAKSTSQIVIYGAGPSMSNETCQFPKCLNPLNFKQKIFSPVLGENRKLLKTMQPKVYVKRLSLPKITGISRLERLRFNVFKNINLGKTEASQLKFEITSVETVNKLCPKITNLQQTSKMLQKMQPKVRVKRLSVAKVLRKSKLFGTCPMNIKEEALPHMNVLSASQNKEKISSQVLSLFTQKINSITDSQHNCKSMQPKVRLKRLRLEEHCSSSLVNANHELNQKRPLKIDTKALALNLQPRVRLRRLKFGDFKFSHQNNNHQLKVDLEVKRECSFYEENAAYELRKRNLGNLRIKEEKLSPKKNVDLIRTSTPKLSIARAFSLQPIVRLNRLKSVTRYNTVGARTHAIGQTGVSVSELETQIKMESLEIGEEQLTPISFAKLYEEEDSGISLDSGYDCDKSSDNEAIHAKVENEPEHNEFSTDDILFEIALQRACINDLLLQNGYSPVQFRLYNNIEELKIFLDYLLVK